MSKTEGEMIVEDASSELVTEQSKSKEVISILLLALALLFGTILWTPPSFGGALGAFISTSLKGLFGTFSYLLPFVFVYFAAELYLTRSKQMSFSRKIFIIFFLYFLILLISLITLDGDKVQKVTLESGRNSAWKGIQACWQSGVNPFLISKSNFWSGGLVGGVSALSLITVLGQTGSLIVTFAMLFALAILTFNVSWKRTLEKTAVGVNFTTNKVRELGKEFLEKRRKMQEEKLSYAHEDGFRSSQPKEKNLSADSENFGLESAMENVLEADKVSDTRVEEPGITLAFPEGNWLKNDFDEPEAPLSPLTSLNKEPARRGTSVISLGSRRSSYKRQLFPKARIRSSHIPLKDEYLLVALPDEDTTNGTHPSAILKTSDVTDAVSEPSEVNNDELYEDDENEIQEIASRITEGEDKLEDIAGREDWDDRSEIDRAKPIKIKLKSKQVDIFDNYMNPPTDLLVPDEKNNVAEDKEEIRLLGAKLEKTLKDFGVDAEVVNFITGPTISRFEVSPGPGVKVSKIVGLADDIALALAATAVRIEAPIPGKSAIGIEIPNKNTTAVRLRDIIEDKDFEKTKTLITAALGRNIQGEPILCDLSSMPHLLIAGATGSGKSVCINSILISLLYKASPKDLRIVMIDPKVVELSVYNGIPHLSSPVVTDPKKAYAVLEWAVKEMEKRYKLFADNSVRDYKAYNELVKQGDVEGGEHLPYILLVIDELSDLMATTPTEVEDAIARLTSMARAAGIHLIIATQRPSVDVITGVIKANIPSRISFAVASQIDSRTILDMGGAEKLLGKGDMLYYPQNASKPLRGQGAFVTDSEVERVVKYLKDHYASSYSESLERELELAGKGGNGTSGSGGGPEEDDELIYEALQVVTDNDYASVSLLQRRLNVGYPRAARMIDSMHDKGWIGPFEGSKPRKLLITPEEADVIIDENM